MKLRLILRKAETDDIESFIFEPEAALKWQAGQFLHYTLPHHDSDDRGTERWFTISTAPYEEHIMLTTRFTNPDGSSFKKALTRLKIGDYVEGDTPEGDFVYGAADLRHILIAGGIGVTPYRSMLLQQDHNNQPINAVLLYANRDDQFVFDAELEAISDHQPDFEIVKYADGQFISKEDLSHYSGLDKALFYISGPKKMVDSYQDLLSQLGVPAEQIKLDFFPGYGAYSPPN